LVLLKKNIRDCCGCCWPYQQSLSQGFRQEVQQPGKRLHYLRQRLHRQQPHTDGQHHQRERCQAVDQCLQPAVHTAVPCAAQQRCQPGRHRRLAVAAATATSSSAGWGSS
jgi:hypothetical protein